MPTVPHTSPKRIRSARGAGSVRVTAQTMKVTSAATATCHCARPMGWAPVAPPIFDSETLRPQASPMNSTRTYGRTLAARLSCRDCESITPSVSVGSPERQ